MDDGRLRKISWYLMGAAACLQAARSHWFWTESTIGSVMSLFSLLSMSGGIYANLKSKQHQPFKQLQLYVFPAIAGYFAITALVPVGTLLWIFAAMWNLSGVRKAGEAAPVLDKKVGKTDWYTVTGGIVGLVAGFIAAAKTMEGSGDSPSGAVPFFCLIFTTCMVGAALGKVVNEARAFKAHEGSGTRMILASIVLVLLCGFWYAVWSGADEGTRKIRSIAAWADLRNCQTNLDAYLLYHRRYPSALEEAQCAQSKDVVITVSRMTKDAYNLIAYHQKGNREYMIRSDSPGVFFRKRDSKEEWIMK